MKWPLKRQRRRREEQGQPAAAVADPTQFLARESLERIGSQMVSQFASQGSRGLAVCGASLGAGASYASLHIAAAFALSGANALLVDADLRSAPHARLLDAGPGGLAAWLAAPDPEPMPEALEILDSLLWIPSGGATAAAGELIATERFAELLDKLMRSFDVVVIDTPPANVWADGRSVARLAKNAVVVARRNRTYLDDVAQLRRELEEDDVQLFATMLNLA